MRRFRMIPAEHKFFASSNRSSCNTWPEVDGNLHLNLQQHVKNQFRARCALAKGKYHDSPCTALWWMMAPPHQTSTVERIRENQHFLKIQIIQVSLLMSNEGISFNVNCVTVLWLWDSDRCLKPSAALTTYSNTDNKNTQIRIYLWCLKSDYIHPIGPDYSSCVIPNFTHRLGRFNLVYFWHLKMERKHKKKNNLISSTLYPALSY